MAVQLILPTTIIQCIKFLVQLYRNYVFTATIATLVYDTLAMTTGTKLKILGSVLLPVSVNVVHRRVLGEGSP